MGLAAGKFQGLKPARATHLIAKAEALAYPATNAAARS